MGLGRRACKETGRTNIIYSKSLGTLGGGIIRLTSERIGCYKQGSLSPCQRDSFVETKCLTCHPMAILPGQLLTRASALPQSSCANHFELLSAARRVVSRWRAINLESITFRIPAMRSEKSGPLFAIGGCQTLNELVAVRWTRLGRLSNYGVRL